MLELAWPWVLLALPAPWLLRRWLPATKSRDGAALRVPFFTAAVEYSGNSATPDKSSRLRLWLSASAWVLLVLAAARPQWLGDPVELPVSGRDLLLAVDISGSMKRPDFSLNGQKATRLDVVQQVAGQFLQDRVGDRLGLILFGTRAYLQTPLTFDRATVQAMLRDAEIGLAGPETAIGDAIGLAVKHLQDTPEDQRVLILLTDGANTAGRVEPVQAARLAAETGLRIYTVGMGAERMRVESFFGPRVVNPSADLDEATLQKIAQMTGGRYFRAQDTEGLAQVYEELDRLEPRASDAEIFRPQTALFHWPLSAALLLSTVIALQVTGPPRFGLIPRRSKTTAHRPTLKQAEEHH